MRDGSCSMTIRPSAPGPAQPIQGIRCANRISLSVAHPGTLSRRKVQLLFDSDSQECTHTVRDCRRDRGAAELAERGAQLPPGCKRADNCPEAERSDGPDRDRCHDRARAGQEEPWQKREERAEREREERSERGLIRGS